MALRNGLEAICGKPSPHRAGATCAKLAGEHQIHRDEDGAEWVDPGRWADREWTDPTETPEGGAS